MKYTLSHMFMDIKVKPNYISIPHNDAIYYLIDKCASIQLELFTQTLHGYPMNLFLSNETYASLNESSTCLKYGICPTSFKHSIIIQIPKKPLLDPNKIINYRLIL